LAGLVLPMSDRGAHCDFYRVRGAWEQASVPAQVKGYVIAKPAAERILSLEVVAQPDSQ
jgi:hypothetical protein